MTVVFTVTDHFQLKPSQDEDPTSMQISAESLLYPTSHPSLLTDQARSDELVVLTLPGPDYQSDQTFQNQQNDQNGEFNFISRYNFFFFPTSLTYSNACCRYQP